VYAQADEIEELSSETEDKEKNLQSIEAQIKADQAKLNALAGQKNTLQNTISNLNYSATKLERDIAETQGDIASTDDEIQTLETQISKLKSEIRLNQLFIKETVVEINKTREKTFWEVFLLYKTFSEYLDRIARFEATGKVLKEKVDVLAYNKDDLEEKNEASSSPSYKLLLISRSLHQNQQVCFHGRFKTLELPSSLVIPVLQQVVHIMDEVTQGPTSRYLLEPQCVR